MRGGLRVGTTGADRDDAVLGLQHVARTGYDERCASIGNRQHGFQSSQHAIRAPVLRELDRGARQMSLMLLELGLEALEQRERIGCRPREARQHLLVVETAHLARARLDDDLSKRHLPVAAERDGAVAAHGEDRRPVKNLAHCSTSALAPWGSPVALTT